MFGAPPSISAPMSMTTPVPPDASLGAAVAAIARAQLTRTALATRT
jgi:hypothetical protein